jgi:2'-5' RNA ligase
LTSPEPASSEPASSEPASSEPASPEPVSGVYVSLAFVDEALALRQAALCRRWGLTPRPELHLTLLYLGDVPPELLYTLGEALRPLSPDWPSLVLRVTGVGAAAGHEAPRLLHDEDALLGAVDEHRVAWWSIDGGVALQALRTRVLSCCEGAGVSIDPVRASFFSPHLTLGSAAPDGEPWDQHVLAKEPSLLREEPWGLGPSVTHLTSSRVHPQSLVSLFRWP